MIQFKRSVNLIARESLFFVESSQIKCVGFGTKIIPLLLETDLLTIEGRFNPINWNRLFKEGFNLLLREEID